MGELKDKLFENLDMHLENRENKRINYYAECTLEEIKAILPDSISEYHTDLIYQWYCSKEKLMLMYFPACSELELIDFINNQDYRRFIS